MALTSSQLAEKAINMRAGSGAFERELEQQIKKRADYNKDLISQLRGIEGQIVAAPGMRSDLVSEGVIRNPLAQEAVLARRRGSLGTQLGSISDLLGERRARQSDLVKAGLSDLMAEADRLAALAQLRAQEEAARRSSGGGINLDNLLGGGGGDGTTTTRKPIDPAEERYNNYIRLGYSEDDALRYAQNGAPADKQAIYQRGGVVGSVGQALGSGLDAVRNLWGRLKYGKNDWTNEYIYSKPKG